MWVPSSGLGASCPGREQATSRTPKTSQPDRGPHWCYQAGAFETLVPAPPAGSCPTSYLQGLNSQPPPGSLRLLQAGAAASKGCAGGESHSCEKLLEHVWEVVEARKGPCPEACIRLLGGQLQTSQPPDGPKCQANPCARSECQEARRGPTFCVFSLWELLSHLPHLFQILLKSYLPNGACSHSHTI